MYVENLGETLNVEHAYLVEGDPAVVPTEIVFENRKPHYFTK